MSAARETAPPMTEGERASLEARVAPKASRYDYFKA